MSFTRERWGTVPTWRDHLLGFGLCVLYVALLLGTADSIGLGRDEGIYVDAAQRYAGWLELLVKAPGQALERAAIDGAFTANHEHPPLMKLLFGVGHLVQRELHIFGTDSQSFRFAGMLSAGGLLWIIYLFGTRLYGRSAGIFAALSFALLPRPFYHAHLNAFDMPITCASTLVLYNYYVSLERPRRALLVGLTFGLALLTKHNSWFLPIMMSAHFGLCAVVEQRARKLRQPRRMSLVPWGLLAALCIGPCLFYGGWPWLWHGSLPRLRDYVGFHLHHEYYNMEYFAVNYFWPPFPISFPWLMTLFTVPLTSLLLGIAGAGRAVTCAVRDLRALLLQRTAANCDPTQPTALLLGALLTPLIVISLPSTPIFGGTKHWFTAYPLLALFAGRTFVEAVALLPRSSALWTKTGLASLLLLPAAAETAHSHPFALSHYTAAAGGVPGAAAMGLNRQFWGFTTRSLVPYLLEVMPNGGTLYICDTLYTSFQMLIRDGHLPATFRPTPDIARADYALVHHEKHFAEVDHQIWTTYRSAQPAHVLLYDGVPIISVYKNPNKR